MVITRLRTRKREKKKNNPHLTQPRQPLQGNNMAHHATITHRRILTSPDPSISSSSSSSSSMDPTLTKHPIPSSSSSGPTPRHPDPTLPSQADSFHLSRPNPDYKTTKTSLKPTKQEPPVRTNTHLRSKAMALSADFVSSKYSSLIKPKNQQHSKTIEPEAEKGWRAKTAKEGEKVKKLSPKEELLEKKIVQQVTVNDKQKKELCAVGKNNSEVKNLLERLDIKRMSVSFGGVGGGGRRKSFCGSQVELADFLANCGAKVVSVDMPSYMQIHAVDCARKTCDSLEKFTSKTLALTLKKEFDGVYGPAWHCIVGTSFGSFVTHSIGGFLYFSMDQKLYILLFKTTVQRAD